MANYYELSLSFKNKKYYKYNRQVHCDGQKIIDNGTVIAEYINHKGREYAVLYNRSNKCQVWRTWQSRCKKQILWL